MNIVKELCVVLLVYSACFGKCQSLGKNPNLKKRMVYNSEKGIAQTLENLVRQADEDLKGEQQFGYIYLQPIQQDGVTFDNFFVDKALLKDEKLPNNAYNAYSWPRSPFNTNFRMAVPDYNQPSNTNYGHSEYQLLANYGLDKMLKTFQRRHKGCPEYVILYSTALPCMYPKNPLMTNQCNQYRVPRCARMTVIAKNSLQQRCPQAEFFLYSDDTTTKKSARKKKVKYLEKNGIILLN